MPQRRRLAERRHRSQGLADRPGIALDGARTQRLQFRLAIVHRCRGGQARCVHRALVVRERGTSSFLSMTRTT
jgi:hypothetical protein